MSKLEHHDKFEVLPGNLGGGPHGLGDPNDKSLRRVEKEVMVPKVMRDVAKVEKCFKEVEEFTNCCKDNSLLMVVSCRKQNSALKDCLAMWYQDEAFRERCTKIYLDDRSEYRRTGIKKKHREVM